jgi:hypothetical protein
MCVAGRGCLAVFGGGNVAANVTGHGWLLLFVVSCLLFWLYVYM